MLDENLNKQPTAEELEEEENALQDSKEDEIRNSIIEKYELDEEDNADLIQKLTEDIIAQRKSFGKVVSQKRALREKLSTIKPVEKKDKDLDPILEAKKIVEEQFMQRDLEELEYSDDIKEEIKKLASMKGLSISKASKDPYIEYLKAQEETQKKIEKATISRTNKGSSYVVTDPDKPLNPSDFDLSTEEGREAWDKAKKARNK